MSGGATLSVSAASYADPANLTATWQASGAGSALNLPNATSVTGSTGYLAELSVQALAGGEVNLPALTNIPGGEVALESDGSGSQFNVPLLANFQSQSTYAFTPALQATEPRDRPRWRPADAPGCGRRARRHGHDGDQPVDVT